jgi:hypothetical protein
MKINNLPTLVTGFRDGIFSLPKFWFGFILVGLGMENVGRFYVHSEYLMAVCYILWSQGIFYPVLVCCTKKNLPFLCLIHLYGMNPILCWTHLYGMNPASTDFVTIPYNVNRGLLFKRCQVVECQVVECQVVECQVVECQVVECQVVDRQVVDCQVADRLVVDRQVADFHVDHSIKCRPL